MLKFMYSIWDDKKHTKPILEVKLNDGTSTCFTSSRVFKTVVFLTNDTESDTNHLLINFQVAY